MKRTGNLGRISVFGAALALSFALTGAADAQERVTLGWSGSFNNDLFGDGKDRWRTSSYATSLLRGPEWTGALPESFGEIIEYRLDSSMIAPANLETPAPGDRPYAGTYTLSVNTHFQRSGYEFSLGAGVSMTGPQTGHGSFQREAHDFLGIAAPSDAVLDAQIGNAYYGDASIEVARPFRFAGDVNARPFVAAEAGVETLLRFGGDVIFGSWGQSDLLVRDGTTGQFYTATKGGTVGYSFVLGGDVAWVADSYYLPSSRGYSLTDARTRLRAGVNWQGEKYGLFYGVTWMGKEFTGQSDTQVVGTLNLRITF